MKQKGWTIASSAVMGVLAVSFGWLWFAVNRLNMLPEKYVWLMLAGLVLVAALFAVWMFARSKPGKGRVRRIVAYVAALALCAGCFVATGAVNKVYETMKAVTENTPVSAIVGVYVMKEDPAQTLADTKDYLFSVTESYDWENTQKALAAMEDELSTAPATQSYESVFAAVNALYGGETGALIVNTAYITILEDWEGFEDYSDKTRLLYEYQVKAETPLEAETTTKPQDAPTGGLNEPFTLYISGSDTRSQVLTTARSDVNILVTVNPKTKQVLLVNTPRDYYVPNPACGGGLDKLTHCGIYGVDCSMGALSALYGVEIPYYAQINFTGFETLIDAVGGVTIYSDTSFTTRHGNVYIQEGENHLNGAEALGYARERYALIGGDNDRGQNQMKVIKAVIEKLASGAIVTNYIDVLNSLQGMFVTNVTQDEIASFVKHQLSDMSGWQVQTYAVTGSGGSDTTASAPGVYCYVMYPHEDTVAHATSLMERVLAGETLTDADVKNDG